MANFIRMDPMAAFMKRRSSRLWWCFALSFVIWQASPLRDMIGAKKVAGQTDEGSAERSDTKSEKVSKATYFLRFDRANSLEKFLNRHLPGEFSFKLRRHHGVLWPETIIAVDVACLEGQKQAVDRFLSIYQRSAPKANWIRENMRVIAEASGDEETADDLRRDQDPKYRIVRYRSTHAKNSELARVLHTSFTPIRTKLTAKSGEIAIMSDEATIGRLAPMLKLLDMVELVANDIPGERGGPAWHPTK